MKHVKQLYKELTNYLNNKQDDRISVTNWYEELKATPQEDALVDTIKKGAKARVFKSIYREKAKLRLRRIYKITAVAAAFIVVFFIWSIYKQPQPATLEQLTQILPAKERAIIVLENGKEINLDQLALNQSIQVGETIITKDAEGKVSYRNAANGIQKIQTNTLKIPKAATYQLTLADGTRVTLNSDSKLTYPSSFGSGDRRVKLEGEGYFEVSHTAENSRFIVAAKNQEIQVLGTKFNVKAYPSEANEYTTLAEGSVRISLGDSKTILHPGEQAKSNAGTINKRTVEIDQVLGWTKGQFCFNGTNTEEVLDEIARWYDIDIHYKGKSEAAQYIGKIPRNLSLDRLIELLNYAELKTKAVVSDDKRINLIIT